MFSVALDGPSGAGKSSVAKAASKKLGFIYVDTGAFYRSIALYVSQNNINCDDESAVKAALNDINLDVCQINGTQHIYLNGEDVTDLIRTPQISALTSKCAALSCVREFLLSFQRDFAKNHDIVMDGRDIGITVLPNANLKIFLVADVNERAKRRYLQLDKTQEFNEVLSDLIKRDYDDENRKVSPLKKAEDAIVLDSTNLSFDEVVEEIYAMVLNKISESEK